MALMNGLTSPSSTHDHQPSIENGNPDQVGRDDASPHAPTSTALEVLNFMGFMTDMLSRHREGLRALVKEECMVKEEDVRMMERLGIEVNNLLAWFGQSATTPALAPAQLTCEQKLYLFPQVL